MPKRGENIRKRKDGRWEGRYKTKSDLLGKTKYISVYGKTYAEVKEKMKKADSIQIKMPSFNKEKTFEDVLNMWRNLNILKHKGATETKYNYLIESHIIPKLGNLKISKITTEMLNEFAEQKITKGRLDNRGGLSAAYVRSMMTIITSVLQYAVNEGIRGPLRTPAYKPIIDKKELTILTPKEQEILENYLLKEMDETKLGVFLSMNCGLRIGEVCAMRWQDIDLENKTISVNATVARIRLENSRETILVIDRPKTQASTRNVPIHSRLLPILMECKEKAKSEFVISKTNQFVSPRTYEYRYHRLLEKCGLKSINYHSLRHAFATKCIMAGVDVKTLSEILGHSTVSITLNTYVHPSMEMKLNQIEKINLPYRGQIYGQKIN